MINTRSGSRHRGFRNLLLVGTLGKNLFTHIFDQEGNRAVDESVEDAHADAESKTPLVWLYVGKKLSVRAPMGAKISCQIFILVAHYFKLAPNITQTLPVPPLRAKHSRENHHVASRLSG